MSYMAWTEHFVTGIPIVDSQHQGLVALVNAAAPHLGGHGNADPAALNQLIARLFDYAAIHFRDEERFMAEAGLSPITLERHASLHNGFVTDVLALQREFEEGTLEGATLLRFLSSWLTFHILGADQAMARQARLIADGMDAERARELVHEEAEADSASAVLQASLLELFALTQERSEALALTNRELRATRRDLEELNAALESRVQKRTEELSTLNQVLQREKDRLAQALDELKRAQLALIQSEKLRAVGQLAAGLAHELNTPLQFVGDAVEFMAEGTAALRHAVAELRPHVPEPLRREVEERHELRYFEDALPDATARARTGIARGAELVRSILTFSQPTGPRPRPTDLGQLLQTTVTVALGQLEQVPGLELAVELGPLPVTPCHPAELSQALLSLLVNGRDAIRAARETDPTRGRLALRAFPDGDAVVIEVEDDGTGIPDHVAPRIFEPFFTTRPVGEGQGQGLSTARAIVVSRHGGELSFTTRPGAGSTFRVRLPMECRPPTGP